MIKRTVIVALLVVTTSAFWDEELDVWQPPDSVDSILYKAENILKIILEHQPSAEDLTRSFNASIKKTSLTKVKTCDWFGGLFFPSTCKGQDGSNLEACRECSNRMQEVCISANEGFITEVETKAQNLVYEVSWMYKRMEQLKQRVKTKVDELTNSTKIQETLLGELSELKLKLKRTEVELQSVQTELDDTWKEAKMLDDAKQATIDALKVNFDECKKRSEKQSEENVRLKAETLAAKNLLLECKDREKNSNAELDEMRKKLESTQWELEQLRNGKTLINPTEILAAIEKLQNSLIESKVEWNHDPPKEIHEMAPPNTDDDPKRKTLPERIFDRAIIAINKNSIHS